MFDFMTLSTHFIYGVGHMMKDYSDSEKRNPLLPHGLLFPLAARYFYMHHTTYLVNILWYTGWNKKYFNGSTMIDRSDDPSYHELHLAPNIT